MKAWHFLYEGNKMRDGAIAPADGVPLVFNGKPILFQQGLHASLHPFDAITHAPGPVLCLVECGGVVIKRDNKIVCTERTIIARMDAADMLRYYARQRALSVVHLWNAPDAVLDYLMGDNAARGAALDAASDAAEAAEWVAAGGAECAAWAASDAAGAAAWSAVSDASDAAWAASDAVWAAARDAAWAAARESFDSLVKECFADYLEAE